MAVGTLQGGAPSWAGARPAGRRTAARAALCRGVCSLVLRAGGLSLTGKELVPVIYGSWRPLHQALPTQWNLPGNPLKQGGQRDPGPLGIWGHREFQTRERGSSRNCLRD